MHSASLQRAPLNDNSPWCQVRSGRRVVMMAKSKETGWQVMRNSCHLRFLKHPETLLELEKPALANWWIHSPLLSYIVVFHARDITYWFVGCKNMKGLGYSECGTDMQPQCLLLLSSPLLPSPERKVKSTFSYPVLWCPRVLQGLALIITQNTPIGRGDALEHMLPHSSASRDAGRLGRVAQQLDGRHTTPQCPVYCWGCPTGAYRGRLSTGESSAPMTGDPGQPKETELCVSMQQQSGVNY